MSPEEIADHLNLWMVTCMVSVGDYQIRIFDFELAAVMGPVDHFDY